MTAVLELLPALWRAVHLAQNFSRSHVARDVWTSVQCRAFSKKLEELDGDGAKKPRPKTEPVPKITLISPDNSTTVTMLEVAQRLAKRRNLTLVKVSDLEGKTQRPLYKLVNIGSLDEIEKDTKDADKAMKKGTKLLYVSAKITEHDLRTKTKNMVRLLNKGHKIKVAIILDGFDGDTTYRAIENAVRNDGSIQRMPSKKNVILLLIKPLFKDKDIFVDNKDETGNSNIIHEKDNM